MTWPIWWLKSCDLPQISPKSVEWAIPHHLILQCGWQVQRNWWWCILLLWDLELSSSDRELPIPTFHDLTKLDKLGYSPRIAVVVRKESTWLFQYCCVKIAKKGISLIFFLFSECKHGTACNWFLGLFLGGLNFCIFNLAWGDDPIWLIFFNSKILHVWNIYLHLPQMIGNCREIFHT